MGILGLLLKSELLNSDSSVWYEMAAHFDLPTTLSAHLDNLGKEYLSRDKKPFLFQMWCVSQKFLYSRNNSTFEPFR